MPIFHISEIYKDAAASVRKKAAAAYKAGARHRAGSGRLKLLIF